ncbi:hypothetical protein BC833DRAFT_594250 [Globomyces pollinis-pini]|nr:hypothetical protein BC833DRAFT_594250 [Globomyces pollinis-pini]
MTQFTNLEYANIIAHSVSLVFLFSSIIVDVVRNRTVIMKAPAAKLLFITHCLIIIFHITGIRLTYLSAISMELKESIAVWTERMLISNIIYISSGVSVCSMLLGVFSYTWTSVNALLPHRKLAKLVSTYATLIVPVILVFLSIFYLSLLVSIILLFNQPRRCYFITILISVIFQTLIGFLLIPVILDLIKALFGYFTLMSRKGRLLESVDMVSFTLFRYNLVALTLFTFVIISAYYDYQEVDISFIISPLPSPNKYDQPNTIRFTAFTNVIFGHSGLIASFLTLGKLIKLKFGNNAPFTTVTNHSITKR